MGKHDRGFDRVDWRGMMNARLTRYSSSGPSTWVIHPDDGGRLVAYAMRDREEAEGYAARLCCDYLIMDTEPGFGMDFHAAPSGDEGSGAAIGDRPMSDQIKFKAPPGVICHSRGVHDHIMAALADAMFERARNGEDVMVFGNSKGVGRGSTMGEGGGGSHFSPVDEEPRLGIGVRPAAEETANAVLRHYYKPLEIEAEAEVIVALNTVKLGALAAEWLRGCTHAPDDPEQCPDCTGEFLAALKEANNR